MPGRGGGEGAGGPIRACAACGPGACRSAGAAVHACCWAAGLGLLQLQPCTVENFPWPACWQCKPAAAVHSLSPLTAGQQALDHGRMLHHPLVIQLQAAPRRGLAALGPCLLARRGAARGHNGQRRGAVLQASGAAAVERAGHGRAWAGGVRRTLDHAGAPLTLSGALRACSTRSLPGAQRPTRVPTCSGRGQCSGAVQAPGSASRGRRGAQAPPRRPAAAGRRPRHRPAAGSRL